ncbi:hypothetical protein FQA39_LY12207 [Lamprigera yunnana]|nr:hypothetical protein FQA39_LY12207 [Lamprigera yunnana]
MINMWKITDKNKNLPLTKKELESILQDEDDENNGSFIDSDHESIDSHDSNSVTEVTDNDDISHRNDEENSNDAFLGKTDKVMRLFENAAIIALQNPDVLNHYGEFIEHMRNDTIVADELYSKTLVYSTDHKAPIINRKLTAYVVNKLDLEIF